MQAVNAKAVTVKKVFSRETTVSIQIDAQPEVVWGILTNAQKHPEWNTTIVSLKGEIKPGSKIELVSKLAPTRAFKLSIMDFNPSRLLSWGDAMGKRNFVLAGEGDKTIFTMTEKMGGPLFPLFAGMIPSFDESFETFAHDLKTVAESQKK